MEEFQVTFKILIQYIRLVLSYSILSSKIDGTLEAIELRNVARMTEQILGNDSPDVQICKESMRGGELKCFKTP